MLYTRLASPVAVFIDISRRYTRLASLSNPNPNLNPNPNPNPKPYPNPNPTNPSYIASHVSMCLNNNFRRRVQNVTYLLVFTPEKRLRIVGQCIDTFINCLLVVFIRLLLTR